MLQSCSLAPWCTVTAAGPHLHHSPLMMRRVDFAPLATSVSVKGPTIGLVVNGAKPCRISVANTTMHTRMVPYVKELTPHHLPRRKRLQADVGAVAGAGFTSAAGDGCTETARPTPEADASAAMYGGACVRGARGSAAQTRVQACVFGRSHLAESVQAGRPS